MGGLFSSPKPAETPPPEKINQRGPTGNVTFGRYSTDPVTGQEVFTAEPGIVTQRTEETPFQQQFREGREGLNLQLLQSLNPNLQSVRTADEIRSIVPTANFSAANRAGAQELLGPESIESRLTANPDISRVGQGLTPMSQDFSGDIQRLEDATFEAMTMRLNPIFERQQSQLDQQLADQGIPINSEAYNEAKRELQLAQGEQLNRASLDAIGAGRAEQERLARLGLAQRGQQFGEQATTFDLERALRGQQFQEGVGLSDVASRNRGQLFDEQVQQFQAALQKQLALAGLEQQQRGQQFSELGALGGFQSFFNPTPIAALGAGSTGATPGGGGYEILGSIAGGLAGNAGLFA